MFFGHSPAICGVVLSSWHDQPQSQVPRPAPHPARYAPANKRFLGLCGHVCAARHVPAAIVLAFEAAHRLQERPAGCGTVAKYAQPYGKQLLGNSWRWRLRLFCHNHGRVLQSFEHSVPVGIGWAKSKGPKPCVL